MSVLRDGRAPPRVPVWLSPTAQYIAPSGRWCRWCPRAKESRSVDAELFLYHLPDGRPAPRLPRSDGFYLTAENLHLMVRVG